MTIPPAQTEAFLKEFGGESDRSAALLGGVYIETLLEHLLRAKLVRGGKRKKGEDLLERSLQNLNVRIEHAFALGLLTEQEVNDLHLIRGIRNAFAHRLSSVGLSFDSEEIALQCYSFGCIGGQPQSTKNLSPRVVYTMAVVTLIQHLQNLARTTRQTPEAKPLRWPIVEWRETEQSWEWPALG